MWASAKQAAQAYGVSASTLRSWARAGQIQSRVATPNGNHRYFIESGFVPKPGKVAESKSGPDILSTGAGTRDNFIYARVSSGHQRADLQRQIDLLVKHYPKHRVLSDIASGINFRRPGLNTLLERVCKGSVNEIVILHRDRLCRFAFDLLDKICAQHGTKILVFEPDSQHASEFGELAEDLLAINTVFICRMQGKRSAAHRRQRTRISENQGSVQVQAENGNPKHDDPSSPHQAQSYQGRKIPLETMVGMV